MCWCSGETLAQHLVHTERGADGYSKIDDLIRRNKLYLRRASGDGGLTPAKHGRQTVFFDELLSNRAGEQVVDV